MIIRQEDEGTLDYNRRSNIRTARRLHLIHNPLQGRYEEQSISFMKMNHFTSIVKDKNKEVARRTVWHCHIIM